MSHNYSRFGGHRSPKAQGIYLAERFRENHQLASGPVERIEQLTELVVADLLVTELPEGVEALTVQDPTTRNLIIGISTSDVPFRQNFSLAHEIGHVCAGDLDIMSRRNLCHDIDGEKRADSFAAHVLCPLDSLEAQLEGRDPNSLEALSHLVQKYKVSPIVAVNQLRRAKLIAPERTSELRKWTAPKLASRFGWRDEYDLEVARSSMARPAPRLAADATQAFLEGRVSAEAVALARGVSTNRVHDELDDLIQPTANEKANADPVAALEDFFGGD